jgi:hypothetical protein
LDAILSHLKYFLSTNLGSGPFAPVADPLQPPWGHEPQQASARQQQLLQSQPSKPSSQPVNIATQPFAAICENLTSGDSLTCYTNTQDHFITGEGAGTL